SSSRICSARASPVSLGGVSARALGGSLGIWPVRDVSRKGEACRLALRRGSPAEVVVESPPMRDLPGPLLEGPEVLGGTTERDGPDGVGGVLVDVDGVPVFRGLGGVATRSSSSGMMV